MSKSRLWLSRILIGSVLIINIQSALAFFLFPSRYAPAYELMGVPGQAAIQGFAVLFLMWNVPYCFALIHPIRNRVSLYEAIMMQSIGLIGETLILKSIPMEYVILRKSILRFIIFDGGGLIALFIAAWSTKQKRQISDIEAT
jgi:hypothetical protein